MRPKKDPELLRLKRLLNIEKATDKVGTVAMRMKQRADMLRICKTIALQLEKLGVEEIRNVQTAIFYKERGTYMNYEYYLKHDKEVITETEYTNNKIHRDFAAKMQKGKGSFMSKHIKGSKVKDWLAYQKTTNVFIDTFLKTASSLNYYWFSLGPVALGISTYKPLDKAALELFKKFLIVFELAYTRYLDIEKAEAQAKEARIEAALERVRARTMAMHRSDELAPTVKILFDEFKQLQSKEDLNIYNRGFITTINHEKKCFDLWITDTDGAEINTFFPIVFEEQTTGKFMYDAWNTGQPYIIRDLQGKVLNKWLDYLSSIGFKVATGIRGTRRVNNFIYYSKGFIGITSTVPITESNLQLLQRFANVFEQTYTRFLDLQKAEAQAKEARIEASLERVRARSMAMHKSEELKHVIRLLLAEFIHLNIKAEHAGFYIDYKSHDDMHIWLADPNIEPFYAVIPYFDTPTWNSFLEAKAKGLTLHTDLLDFKTKNKFYKSLFKIFTIPEKAKKFYLKCKGLAVSTVLLDNVGLYIENFSAIPYTDEENNILIRFGKVFQQTYTRFLDLQKAEEQAREAQIEAALERVRSRTMAMHKSTEVMDVAVTLYEELQKLAFQPGTTSAVTIVIMDRSTGHMTHWLAGFLEKSHIESYAVENTDHPLHAAQLAAWQRGEKFATFEIKGNAFRAYAEEMFSRTGYKNLPEEEKIILSSQEHVVFNLAFMKHGALMWAPTALTEFNATVLQRFANVFEQTYTRFLDLQKAEAQAREAEIQLALERVRARSLAMHHTKELVDIVAEVFEQLKTLRFSLDGSAIVINLFNNENDDITQWIVDENHQFPYSFHHPHFDNPITNDIKKARQNGISYFSAVYPNEVKNKFWNYYFEHTDFKHFPDNLKEDILFRENYAQSMALEKHTGLLNPNINGKVLNEEQQKVLQRFARVFEQAYVRFLDLKKAEAQARESQIQLALERVRARTMAMQKSEELSQVASLMFEQLSLLGASLWICGFVICSKESNVMENWIAPPGGGIMKPLYLPNTIDEFSGQAYSTWKEQGEMYADIMQGEQLQTSHEALLQQPTMQPAKEYLIKNNIPLPTSVYRFAVPYTFGYLMIVTTDFFTEKEIFIRLSKVFDQTYTRFLDLQKAEAQARESQIQLALERVRARTMAMQRSDELQEAANVLFRQVKSLGIPVWSCGYNIWEKDEKICTGWMSTEDAIQPPFKIPLTESPVFIRFYKSRQNNETFYTEKIESEDLVAHYKYMFNLPDFKKIGQDHMQSGFALPQSQIHNVSNFSHGNLIFISSEPVPEAHNIFIRFTKVFEQTYTRFLDLQKAEAQAREAQIEAALERVRARTMGMQKSEELSEVAAILFKQVSELGIKTWTTGFNVWSDDEDYYTDFITTPQGNIVKSYTIDTRSFSVFKEIRDAKKSRRDFLVQYLEGALLQETYKRLAGFGNENQYDQMLADGFEFPSHQYNHFVFSSKVSLMFITYEEMSAEVHEIFKRFGKVFEQTYTRFLDLQKAEAQAREAQIETALERVRSKTMAMQKSDELAETASVLFKQLITLGIEPNRLYIGIIHDKSGDIEAWATDEEGGRISSMFTLSSKKNSSVKKMYEAWSRQEKTLVIDMQGKELHDYVHYLDGELKIPISVGLQQQRRVQHMAFFSHGFIGIASPEEQPAETLQLLERFAYVFNLTFTRFNDLKVGEAHAIQAEKDLIEIMSAKKKAEQALSELQATQKQLIQSEKMASLGELTAGIAHEIQNPLNFVNNFSEVSNELIAEMTEELDKGDIEEAKAIANDIKQNLEKINHHGKRADGIVKGMLQHSRTSSGQKELTDINNLCDEYIRLSYHGLRAKDKTFNAKFETSFDTNIHKINIVPQDIGRVILNLINNAFYAVNERKKIAAGGYEPTVIISTKQNEQYISISVRDNGNGIPAAIKEKIFQPFFTTKPTGLGTGLGLSLSYDIIKAHNGEIKMETLEGEGTEFIIMLPVTE